MVGTWCLTATENSCEKNDNENRGAFRGAFFMAFIIAQLNSFLYFCLLNVYIVNHDVLTNT